MTTNEFLKIVEESKNVEYEVEFGTGKRIRAGYFIYCGGFLQCVVNYNGRTCEIKVDTLWMPSDEREKVIDAFVELMRTPPSEQEELCEK